MVTRRYDRGGVAQDIVPEPGVVYPTNIEGLGFCSHVPKGESLVRVKKKRYDFNK